MTIEEWNNLDTFFDEIDSEFYFAYSDYKNGSNQKKRAEAERIIRQVVDRADRKVKQHIEIYNQYTGGENATPYARVCAYEDFKSYSFFRGNISQIRGIIKDEIKKLS
ncbi:hypothetical protein [Flavobacterium sp. HTF]|uniref:hypothetical protein n=1 Tax=Flavobacterium sp. HTF TaxID=2170732 RepID=UPI000D5F65EA|nr:hypothetical protein [Flavobacterium sp. HTF]PWB25427.1 hypothetical protein DCO46_08700 [Flavobacterium sp. HTF]